jgi:hypothetical protein
MPGTDKGPILGSALIHLGSTIVLVCGGIVAVNFWRNPVTRREAVIVLAISAIPWVITIVRLWRLRRAMGTAALLLDDPIPLGFSGTATYVRRLRDAQLRTIEARLQCEEEVVRGRGRNSKRVQMIVHDEPLTPQVTPAMERLEVRLPFRIPPEGPPSMWHEVASITWRVRLRIKMSGCPNTASSFEILVSSTVVER